MANKATLNIASAVLALLIMALLVWDASDAAFSATTDESGSVATPTIALTDDGAVTLNFAPVLAPDESASECVDVTFDASAGWTVNVDAVSVYGTAGGDSISGMDLTVGVLAGDCAGGGPATQVFSTAHDSLPAAPGVDSVWTPTTSNETRGFVVTADLDSAAGDSEQGKSATFSLTWLVTTP